MTEVKNEDLTYLFSPPGEMLREDFMPDYELTTKRLAEGLRVSRQTGQAGRRLDYGADPG